MPDHLPNPSPFIAHISGVHHVAVIASDIERSKRFCMDVLGCRVVAEQFRAARRSRKVDLAIPDCDAAIELFTFPNAPPRPSTPEALGLRPLAFRVRDITAVVAQTQALGIAVEPIRIDAATGKQFTFFKDPDGLPIESYQT